MGQCCAVQSKRLCVQLEIFAREVMGLSFWKINLPPVGGWIRVSNRQNAVMKAES